MDFMLYTMALGSCAATSGSATTRPGMLGTATLVMSGVGGAIFGTSPTGSAAPAR